MLLDNELKIDIASDATKIVMKRIISARSISELRAYLKSMGLEELTPEIDNFQPNGDIYILGDLSIKDNIVYQIFKDLSIDVNRVKIVKGYNEFKTYNFNRFQHDYSVRLIFVGPMPHSTQDKGDYSSIISRIEQEEGFPKIVRLGVEGNLKVTKTNLKEAVIKEIESNYLDTN
ncbi:hypothetical protein C3B72_05510 [Clostridium tetani]|uniref:hypothetical protein n=1 Tax=Clostridium tetani TaxID=1513 RepID=UPI000D1FE5F1|nr:hypothetical protein [Clostridium tetani]AVP54610.1 hypothetical protein C3B72_05510 [Clostridium tetani]